MKKVPAGHVNEASHLPSTVLNAVPEGHPTTGDEIHFESEALKTIPDGQDGGASHSFIDESKVVPGGQEAAWTEGIGEIPAGLRPAPTMVGNKAETINMLTRRPLLKQSKQLRLVLI